MKRLFLSVSCAALLMAGPVMAMPDAPAGHGGMMMDHAGHMEHMQHMQHMEHAEHGQHGAAQAPAAGGSIRAEVVSPSTLTPGKPVTVTIRLTERAGNRPLTLDALKEVHTRKVHMLVIDPTLTDYHHVHPEPTGIPGEYTFSFTPQKAGYRVWTDLLPTATGKQEYARTDLGTLTPGAVTIDRTEKTGATVEGYSFHLRLDGTPKAGEAVMATLTVTRDGKPVDRLEPVMGAFAHMVGFGDDFRSVMHIHPMGQEPTTGRERGGPTLRFHLEPERAGFIRLFAQFRINGQDLFAPFGIVVQSNPAKE